MREDDDRNDSSTAKPRTPLAQGAPSGPTNTTPPPPSDDESWIAERLDEYRDLLEYLRQR